MSQVDIVLIAMTYLLMKHYICDFPIHVQTPWMFLNKGTYGHPGGYAHALVHVSATLLLLLYFLPFGTDDVKLSMCLSIEFLVHYHMDWFKMWWCKKKGYRLNTHPQFWTWLGIDQLVHGLTYVAILVMLTR